MTRRCALVVVALTLAACPRTRSNPAVAPIVNDTPTAARPFFWRVDTPAGPSYLLGTMHVGVDAKKAFATNVWRVFDAARTVVLEVSIKGLDTLGLGMQPEGQSLKKQMKPGQWARLLAALKVPEGSSSARRLNEVRAWVVVAEIINTVAPPAPSIDTTLRHRADELGKKLVFLESVKVQAAILDKYATVDYLLYMVEHLRGQRASLAADVKTYLSGDAAAFYKSAVTGMEKQIGAAGMEQLLYARNRAWISALTRAIDAGAAFIAVGTAHLLGDRGVVALLRKRGYKVSRVAARRVGGQRPARLRRNAARPR